MIFISTFICCILLGISNIKGAQKYPSQQKTQTDFPKGLDENSSYKSIDSLTLNKKKLRKLIRRKKIVDPDELSKKSKKFAIIGLIFILLGAFGGYTLLPGLILLVIGVNDGKRAVDLINEHPEKYSKKLKEKVLKNRRIVRRIVRVIGFLAIVLTIVSIISLIAFLTWF